MTTAPNAASVALIRDDMVLLIQRAYAPYQYLWTLPGGRVEPGESAEQCAAREVREEIGLTVAALRPVLEQSLKSASGNWRLAVFASAAFTGNIVASDEIADHRWLRLDQLSELRTTAGLDDVLVRAFAVCART